MRTAVLLATLAAAFIAADASSKLLPTVRAGLSLGSLLLRHVAEVKDRLRADIERHLLQRQPWLHDHQIHVFKLFPWKPPVQWSHPSFHSSFNYQASASGSLPLLPLFPRPSPHVVLVPCRNPRPHITHIVLPCVRIIGNVQEPAGTGLGVAPQSNNVTTNELFPRWQNTTALPNYDVTESAAHNSTEVTNPPTDFIVNGQMTTSTPSKFPDEVVTGGVTFIPSTRAADVTEATSVPEGDITTNEQEESDVTEATTVPEGDITTKEQGETGTVPTASDDDANETEELSTEPEDRRANTVPEDSGRPATTVARDSKNTTGQPGSTDTPDMDYDAMPTDSVDFNDVLMDADVNFGKLTYQ